MHIYFMPHNFHIFPWNLDVDILYMYVESSLSTWRWPSSAAGTCRLWLHDIMCCLQVQNGLSLSANDRGIIIKIQQTVSPNKITLKSCLMKWNVKMWNGFYLGHIGIQLKLLQTHLLISGFHSFPVSKALRDFELLKMHQTFWSQLFNMSSQHSLKIILCS